MFGVGGLVIKNVEEDSIDRLVIVGCGEYLRETLHWNCFDLGESWNQRRILETFHDWKHECIINLRSEVDNQALLRTDWLNVTSSMNSG